MASLSSPSLPPTSDPALYDDLYELDQSPIVLPSSVYLDELEAIHLTHEESIARKNKQGQVIQHRAWGLVEAFWSDLDHLQGTKKMPLSVCTI